MSLNYLQYWSAVLAFPSAFNMHEEKMKVPVICTYIFSLLLKMFLLKVKLSNLEKRQRCSVFMRKHKNCSKASWSNLHSNLRKKLRLQRAGIWKVPQGFVCT